MLDIIHIHEKWFNLMEITEGCDLANDEDDPYCTCHHKSHILQIMFLVATAWSCYDHHTKTMWDGKIRMWECCDYVAAQWSSRSRPNGTIKPKPYNIDGGWYKDCILEKLLPAIADKCPLAMKSKPIIVQHDNAPPHHAVFSSLPELIDRSDELGITVHI